ncbi:MAG: hypothetical protein QOG72_2423 [Sphingomonadales bacterium]|jgi:hypothetical protein|nr:hypothetical protein [Sphingomonadales bacterium]
MSVMASCSCGAGIGDFAHKTGCRVEEADERDFERDRAEEAAANSQPSPAPGDEGPAQ